jgi:hypothetical protein
MAPPAPLLQRLRVCAEAIVAFLMLKSISFRVNSCAGDVTDDAHRRGSRLRTVDGSRHERAAPAIWRVLSAVRSIAHSGEKVVKRPHANMKISAS